MKGRGVTPIASIGRRPPEAGRLRMGKKVLVAGKDRNGKQKSRPDKLDRYRLTSPRRDLIEQVAQLYGGRCEPWHDPSANPPNQFEVTVTEEQLPVWLVPDSIDTNYELWDAGGRVRNCDGELCETPMPAGEYDYRMEQVPCICGARGELECKITTRLQVILPAVEFAGVWRLESHGWNATHELPGMFDMIQTLGGGRGVVPAMLGIQSVERMHGGKKRNYVVPKLSIQQTVLAIASGGATPLQLAAAAQPQQPQLGTGMPDAPALPSAPSSDPDDDIIEGEIVDYPDHIQRLRADAEQFGLDPERYVDAIVAVTDGDVQRMLACSAQVRGNRIEPTGFKDGRVTWRTLKAGS